MEITVKFPGGRFHFPLLKLAKAAAENPADLEEVLAGFDNRVMQVITDDVRTALAEQVRKHVVPLYQEWLANEESLKNRAETRWNELKALKQELKSTAETCEILQKLANRLEVDKATIPEYQPHKLPDFLETNVPD